MTDLEYVELGSRMGWWFHAPVRGEQVRTVHQVGSVSGGSAVTLCNGRFDAEAWDEMNPRPEHHRRCEACERVRIERCRVERGLAELVEVA